MDFQPLERKSYRTIWISDFHLGTKRAQAESLLSFIAKCDCQTMYLVGDIVDNWALKKSWQWDQSHNDVIQKLLRKARKGTNIIYIPGNHDEPFRDMINLSLGNIQIMLNAVHTTVDGKTYLVLHGDEFDGVIQYAKWLAFFGDQAYEVAMNINIAFNKLRRMFGLPYWSLSAYLKRKVKRAVEFLSNFEDAVVQEAKIRGTDGVICGHVHTPEMRMIDGIHYCNDGDWVESCSALVEHHNGQMEIIYWPKSHNLTGASVSHEKHTAQDRALAVAS